LVVLCHRERAIVKNYSTPCDLFEKTITSKERVVVGDYNGEQ
jgi:hypothetical protein